MRTAAWVWAALVVCAGGWTWSAEKKDANAPKTPEEVLAESKDRSTVAGKFRLDQACLTDGKPLPKLVGTLTQEKGITYMIMVAEDSFLKVLQTCDGQNVTLCGKIARIEQAGAFLLADSQITPPTPPVTHTKRGGL